MSLNDCNYLSSSVWDLTFFVFSSFGFPGSGLKGRNLKKEYTTESWNFCVTVWSPSILKIPQMKQCWIGLWTVSLVTTLDLSAWCFLCLRYSCVSLKSDIWGTACCFFCNSYNILIKVSNRPDVQQFWRKKWFTKYSPWWFCNHNFLNTLYVCFIIHLYRLIWPDPSLFYFYIEFYFFSTASFFLCFDFALH